jgi:hypothetical protein
MGNTTTVTATFRLRPRPQTRFGNIDIEGRSARFRFTSSGVTTHFQCSLARDGHRASWRHCSSPKHYSHLKPAAYTFRVRAVGPQGPDRSPAMRKFTVT